MSKEIKFKGKRVDNDEWVFGYFFTVDIDDKNRFFIIPFSSYCGKEVTIGELQVEIKKETLCQFTNKNDNNGNNIFDGDIVTYDGTPYLVNALKATGVIVNHKGSWALKYKASYKTSDGRDYYNYYQFSCEDFFDRKSIIIGNIFDNPNLLQ